MKADRLDLLLDRALREGIIPPEASPEERAEVERLMAASTVLRAGRDEVDTELTAVLPVARARFERFVAAESAVPVRARAAPSAGGRFGAWLTGGLVGIPRVVAVAGPVAAVVLLGAILVARTSLGDVEAAVALESGDYVQLEGSIAGIRPAGDDLQVDVRTGAGRFVVVIRGDVAVTGTAGEDVPARSLQAGAVLVVDGFVEAGRVRAITVALGGHRPEGPAKLTRVDKLRGTVAGTVLLVRLSESGSRGEVVVLADDGRRVIVPVTGGVVEALLERFSTALGERVELTASAGGAVGLRPARGGADGQAPTPPDGRPALAAVRGVVAGVSDGRLDVRTLNGQAAVATTARTRFLVNSSGVAPAAIRDGRTIVGHTVAVTGRRDPQTGAIIAELVIVGPRLADVPAR